MPCGGDRIGRLREPAVRGSRSARSGNVFDAGHGAARDRSRRSGVVQQHARGRGIRALSLGRSDVREDWSLRGARSRRPPGRLASTPAIRRRRAMRGRGLDATLEAAAAAHVTPILDVSGIPRWAYAKRPKSGSAGTPKAAALGDFAHALATRYDGTNGLPAEHVFQVWNEPNLSLDLGPVSASAYRGMVNAFADAVHGVDSSNLVVAGALDPFGHPKGKKQKWYSVAPLAYMRSLLCLSKGSHPHSTCHNAVHFDAWSHHPYTFGGPFGHATHPDDVELGDLPRMRAVLKAGVRLHHVVSAHPVKFWVTEFGWDSSPPRPHAAPMGLASRWTAESLHQMWISGVSLVTWFDLQDRRSPSPYQSGLYFHSSSLEKARPKPLRTAFRFPFVAYLGGLDRQRLGSRRDEQQGSRHRPASARQERKLAHRRVHRRRTATGSSARRCGPTPRRRTGCARSRPARGSRFPSRSPFRTPRTSAPGATSPTAPLAFSRDDRGRRPFLGLACRARVDACALPARGRVGGPRPHTAHRARRRVPPVRRGDRDRVQRGERDRAAAREPPRAGLPAGARRARRHVRRVHRPDRGARRSCRRARDPEPARRQGRGAGRSGARDGRGRRRLLRRERDLGARRAAQARPQPCRPGSRLRLRAAAARGSGRLEQGGRLLALRARDAGGRVAARLGHGGQRRDLCAAPVRLCRGRSPLRARPLASLPHGAAGPARGVRAGGARLRAADADERERVPAQGADVRARVAHRAAGADASRPAVPATSSRSSRTGISATRAGCST